MLKRIRWCITFGNCLIWTMRTFSTARKTSWKRDSWLSGHKLSRELECYPQMWAVVFMTYAIRWFPVFSGPGWAFQSQRLPRVKDQEHRGKCRPSWKAGESATGSARRRWRSWIFRPLLICAGNCVSGCFRATNKNSVTSSTFTSLNIDVAVN